MVKLCLIFFSVLNNIIYLLFVPLYIIIWFKTIFPRLKEMRQSTFHSKNYWLLKNTLAILWVIIIAFLIFLIFAGFVYLASSLSRTYRPYNDLLGLLYFIVLLAFSFFAGILQSFRTFRKQGKLSEVFVIKWVIKIALLVVVTWLVYIHTFLAIFLFDPLLAVFFFRILDRPDFNNQFILNNVLDYNILFALIILSFGILSSLAIATLSYLLTETSQKKEVQTELPLY